MKLWRKEAGLIGRRARRMGNHQPGMRYGRLAKAVTGSVRLKAIPSTLFMQMAAAAGIIKLESPKDEVLPMLGLNGLPT